MIEIRADNYTGTAAYPLVIGRKGEHLVRVVAFCLDTLIETYGEGTWEVINVRPTETLPYLAGNTYDGITDTGSKYACWNVSNTDTSIQGTGKVELRYYPSNPEGLTAASGTSDDGRIYKSKTWVTKIEDSLGSTYYESDPYSDVLDRMAGYAGDAKTSEEAAAKSAEAAASHDVNMTNTLIKVAEYANTAKSASSDAQKYSNTAETCVQVTYDYAKNAETAAINASKYADEAFSTTPEGYEDVALNAQAAMMVDDDGMFYCMIEDGT